MLDFSLEQIADFLQKYISPKAITLIAYEAEITSHLDAYLQQIFPEGRILIVTEAYWREYAERTLIPSLKAHGCETEYCLCVKTAGVPYSTQIEESLADGALSGIVGIAALGTHDLFEAVRDRAAFLDIACCALLHELPRQDVLNSCGENRPTADALFFDLNAIMQQLHGDGREKSLELEIDTYALSADIAVAKAMGSPIPAGVSEAIHEAVPPRLPQGKLTEDDLAELCEAYMWRAAAARLMPYGSFCTVMEYLNDGADFPTVSRITPKSWPVFSTQHSNSNPSRFRQRTVHRACPPKKYSLEHCNKSCSKMVFVLSGSKKQTKTSKPEMIFDFHSMHLHSPGTIFVHSCAPSPI